MSPGPKISVVMPTFNCAPRMARHLEAMAKWSDLAHEIIVVDSRSSDGTLELIQAKLRHPRLRIIVRDRGLYESWNEGIAATTGDWIYISTAGDTIEREHLVHLRDLGERAEADVVISAPSFIDEAGAPCTDPGWPPGKIIAASGEDGPFMLNARAAFLQAFMHFPCAILGSSASNLYRGDHLRPRPFPADFKGAGDSVWILHHAARSRVCFTPAIGSTFCIHAKADDTDIQGRLRLLAKLSEERTQTLARLGLNCEPARLLIEHHQLADEVQAVNRGRRQLWHKTPRTGSNFLAWTSLTMTYLRKRAAVKASRRRIQRLLMGREGVIPVADRG